MQTVIMIVSVLIFSIIGSLLGYRSAKKQLKSKIDEIDNTLKTVGLNSKKLLKHKDKLLPILIKIGDELKVVEMEEEKKKNKADEEKVVENKKEK